MSLGCGITLAATVYKWVDEQGVTHYSDQPYPGAKKLEVQAAQTYTAPPPPATRPVAGKPGAAAEGRAYQVCELARPTAEQVLFNVTSVTAKLNLDPALRPGDKVAIALDGVRMTGLPSAAEEFSLSPVYRGTHSVMAAVEDSQGKSLCQTAAVTFHIRQTSVRAPQSPTRPPTRP
jgi:hypothetical protein